MANTQDRPTGGVAVLPADQGTVSALEDIQRRLGEQLQANEAQRAQLALELQEQHVRLSQSQVHVQQIRSEIGQWQELDQRNARDLKRAQEDARHAKGTPLGSSRLERVTAADSAAQKSKYELGVLTSQLEKATQEQGRIEEQARALTVKLNDLAGTRDELAAVHGRYALEHVSALQALGEEALQAYDNEIATAFATLEHLQARREEELHQTGRKLAAIAEQAALDFLAEHMWLEVDSLPAIVALKTQLAQAEAEARRGPEVSWGDDASTHAAYERQVNELKVRIDVVGKQVRQRAARELLKQTSLV